MALISSLSIILLSLHICIEKVRRMQFISKSLLIYLHISSSFRYYNPPTQCLYAWPPDQLAPAILTLLPLASTILALEVVKGN